MSTELKIDEQKTAWVAWSNTDTTEGRGWPIPVAVCETRATAIRLGAKRGVMGSDCGVTECQLVKVLGRWLGPVYVQPSTKEDDAVQARMDKRAAAIQAAKEAGLTEQQIKDIYQP